MTKDSLVAELERRANLSKRDARVVVDACFRSLVEALYADGRVELRGFGSFFNKNHRSYMGHNPKTRSRVRVSAKKIPSFRPGKALKELVEAGRGRRAIREA